MLVLVLGGARSGKSEVAERRAAAAGARVTYVATAAPSDDDADHRSRIEAHRARRPADWDTVELDSGDLAAAVANLEGTVLVDSLGTWVARATAMEVDGRGLAAVLTSRPGLTVVVSEEVGLGVHPATEVGRRFRDRLGEVNRAVADVADEVVLVVAGRLLRLEP